jgi:hypothetical protein
MPLDRVIAALEATKTQRTVSDERFIREQRILDELAPRLWRDVRQALQSACKAHAEHFHFEVQPEPLARIRCTNRRVLEVEYLSESRTVVFGLGDVQGEFAIRLDGQNRAALYDGEGKVLPSAAYLADELLTLSLQ